jgi:hypothetical protein
VSDRGHAGLRHTPGVALWVVVACQGMRACTASPFARGHLTRVGTAMVAACAGGLTTG